MPGIGSTLAATLGYTSGKIRHEKTRQDGDAGFGEGVPGNAAAVFLILAADSIGGFNPGPTVFRLPSEGTNPELVIAFGLFTMMMANIMNWTVGGVFMRSMGVMTRIPKHRLLPIVLLLTLTAIYIQETKLAAIWIAIGFGFLGYFMRRLATSPLPFIIAFILGGRLEDTARQAFSATGGDPWFLFSSTTSIVFLVASVVRCRRNMAFETSRCLAQFYLDR